MRVLSLFDGMACGMLAMLDAGIDVERYVAFEIDKYAIQSATHNFPMIEERGDVFKADFTEFRGFDFLLGGSPCTFWSIAKKDGRETEASGMGWELFSQYVRALREAQPRWFVYENNKSMSNAIRESITKTFGFEPICINSALVSAQNRNRLYWVGKREADGTYSKVHIEQPLDRGILLKDVLDGAVAWQEKAFAYTTRCQAAIPSDTLEKHRHTMVAEPVACRCRGRKDTDGTGFAKYECRDDGKANTLDTNTVNGAMVAEPVCMRYERSKEAKAIRKQYEAGEAKHGFRELSELHPRPDGKTNTLSTVLKDNPICEPVPAYATPCEWDENGKPVKAISAADGKTYTVYEVKDGQITIKGKQYPIKLADGFYIIRKLTVSECKRLQTVPEWYDFSVVSDSQAFRQLGNGWTISVISHLLTACLKPAKDEDELYCDTEGNYRFF